MTELGISILVKLEQSQKASFPIEVTELGIFMYDKLEQSLKDFSPIEVTVTSAQFIVTEDGMITSVGDPESNLTTPSNVNSKE